jgi:hypothetical protein
MSGVLGGGLHVMAALILGGQFILPVVGASAGIFGLIAAFATLYPERPLTMLVAFIIPIEMRAKFLLLFEALIAVFGIIVPVGCVAHAAHLGGMLLGIAYIRWFVQAEQTVLAWRRRRPAPRPPVLARANAPKPVFWRQPKPDVGADLPPEEFISREVDPILDKISAQGIHSLTAQERRILELARAKMSKK